MPEVDSPPIARRRRLRLSVRGMLVLVAVVGLAMGLGQFWLANFDTDQATLTFQMRTLADRDAPVAERVGAIDGLIQARGRQARRAMRVLAASLDDPSPEIRIGALAVIGKLTPQLLNDTGPTAIETIRPAVVRLPEMIDDPDIRVAEHAVYALGMLDPEVRDQLLDREDLVEKLSTLIRIGGWSKGSEGFSTRRAAIELLAWIDASSDSMPSWLADALRDPDPDIREFAFGTALDFVSRTRLDQEAPTWLLASLADEHPEVRRAARWACSTRNLRGGSRGPMPRWTNPDEVAMHLSRRLDATEGDERIELIAQLAINDPDRAAGHLPEVINTLEERLGGPFNTRSIVLSTLEQLGPDSLPSVPILCKAAEGAMEDGNVYEFEWVVRLIVSLGAADSSEAQDLIRAMIARDPRDPLNVHWFEVLVTTGLDVTDALVEASRTSRDDPEKQQAITKLMDAFGIDSPPDEAALHGTNSQD